MNRNVLAVVIAVAALCTLSSEAFAARQYGKITKAADGTRVCVDAGGSIIGMGIGGKGWQTKVDGTFGDQCWVGLVFVGDRASTLQPAEIITQVEKCPEGERPPCHTWGKKTELPAAIVAPQLTGKTISEKGVSSTK